MVSTFSAAAYLSLGLPAVLTGLISQRISTVDANVWTSGLVAAIVVAAVVVVVVRTFGAAPAPAPPSVLHIQRQLVQPAGTGQRGRGPPESVSP